MFAACHGDVFRGRTQQRLPRAVLNIPHVPVSNMGDGAPVALRLAALQIARLV